MPFADATGARSFAQPPAPDAPMPPIAGEHEASSVIDDIARYIGVPTTNDGLADAPNPGPYAGNRQRRVEAIDEQIAQVEQQQTEVHQQIEELTKTVTEKEQRASAADGVAKVLSPILGVINLGANALGKSFNPVADRMHDVQGTRDDIEQLDGKREDLETTEAKLRTDKERLQREQALNFMTNVIKTMGMSPAGVRAVDGLSSVRLVVAPYDGDGSEAQYDPTTKIITIRPQTLDKIIQVMERVRADAPGAIDADGKVIDTAAFDRSEAGDEGISLASLLLHEVAHAEQDARGALDPRDASGAAPVDHESAVEYQAYFTQEQASLRGGDRRQEFLTILPDGTPLPQDQAMANVRAFQAGEPLPFGVSADRVLRATDDGPGTESPHDRTDPKDQSRHGRRWPGEPLDGRRWPGQPLDGRRWPGESLHGRRWPGEAVS